MEVGQKGLGFLLFRQGAAEAEAAQVNVLDAVVRGLVAKVTKTSTTMGTHRLCPGGSSLPTRRQGHGTTEQEGQMRKDSSSV